MPRTRASNEGLAAIPPLPCEPGTSPFRIKGLALRGLVHLVERRVPGGLDAFVAALEDKRLGHFVRQPFLAATFYDLLPMLPLTATLARFFGTTLDELARTQGNGQAKYDAGHAYKAIVGRGTLDDLASRLPRLGAQYYDFGTYDARVEGPQTVVVKRGGVPVYLLPWFLPMHAAYAEEVLRLMGATKAHSTARAARPVKGPRGFDVADTETTIRFA